MELYVNDMIVKSMVAFDYLKDLQETFDCLLFYNMRLDPQKCVFGATS